MSESPHRLVINLSRSTPPDQREQRIPFTAEDHVQRERDAVEGEKHAWAHLRAQRNARLAASDWTQVIDAPTTVVQRKAWQAYRKALRDLPATLDSPDNPPWPVPPDAKAST